MGERASFGPWLRQRRKALRLTQEELADRISWSTVMVRKIEAGERSVSRQMADLLAEAFSVVPGERAAFVQFAQGQLSTHTVERALWQTLHAVKPHPTNLASPLTTLIGREEELKRLRTLLLSDSERLITLTGPPGIGKTRLSLEVGAELLDHFEDGVFFVSLANVVDPDLVLAAIAHVLGLTDKSITSLLSKLQSSLNDKHLLLMLDNFEQVLDASPAVVDLLGACPHLKVLITSREALHIYGEHQFPVPPLSNADPRNLPSIETMQNIPAVALFIERAQAVKPDFALTEQNASAVAWVCAQLDGLPLAIELAAARIRLLSPQEMHARLDSRLPLLTGGPRNMPARQRTLRAAINWSYNLLNESEQTLFGRLGVFVGGCTLLSAEAICNANNDLAFDVQDGVGSLLDKNLLKWEEGVDGVSRYTMLETIHEYAREKLEERGEVETISHEHANYFLRLVDAAEPQLWGPTQALWFARLDEEFPNLGVAASWLLDRAALERVARMGPKLRRFCYHRGHQREVESWMQRVLAHGEVVPHATRAAALFAAGTMATWQADLERAQTLLEESIRLYREVGDARGLALALHSLGMNISEQGDPERAISLWQECLALWQDIGYQPGMAMALMHLGDAASELGRFDYAEACWRDALEVWEALGDDLGHALTLYLQATSLLGRTAFGPAAVLFIEAVPLFRHVGNLRRTADCLCGLALAIGSRDEAAASAARLFGAAEAVKDILDPVFGPGLRQQYEQEIAAISSRIDPASWATAWADGRSLTIDQALAYALYEDWKQ